MHDRTELLEKFITELSRNLLILDSDCELKASKYLDVVKQLSKSRIDYSVISRFVLYGSTIKSREEEMLEILELNIDLLISKSESETNIKKTLYKIKDHINLTLIQKKYNYDTPIRDLQSEVSKVSELNKKLSDKVKKVELDKQSVEEEVKNLQRGIYTSIITVLGIFTAIIFGVFGGMEILSNVLSNISTVKISKLLIFSSLIIGSILTILYMLLIGVANITELTIRNCGCRTEESCEHSPFQKHPIYFTGMVVSLYLFMIGVFSHGYETKNLKGISFLDELMLSGSGIFILSFVLFIVILIVFYLWNRFMTKK